MFLRTRQSTVKGEEKTKKPSYADIKYRSTDKVSLVFARTVGNLMEQAIPFLTGLWLHAIMVSPSVAASIGG